MHPNRREELDLFKNRINLTEYASTQGYVLANMATTDSVG